MWRAGGDEAAGRRGSETQTDNLPGNRRDHHPPDALCLPGWVLSSADAPSRASSTPVSWPAACQPNDAFCCPPPTVFDCCLSVPSNRRRSVVLTRFLNAPLDPAVWNPKIVLCFFSSPCPVQSWRGSYFVTREWPLTFDLWTVAHD